MRNGVIYDLKIDLGLKLTISTSFGDFIYFQGLYRKSARVIKTYEYQTCPRRIPTRNTKKKTLEDTRRSHVEDGAWRPQGGHAHALGWAHGATSFHVCPQPTLRINLNRVLRSVWSKGWRSSHRAIYQTPGETLIHNLDSTSDHPANSEPSSRLELELESQCQVERLVL